MLQEKLQKIVSQFQLEGTLSKIERFGSGNINATFRSTILQQGRKRFYIHQKINKSVFPFPERVLDNIARVTKHIQQKLKQDYSPHSRKTTLNLIPTQTGALYHLDRDGEYWRTTAFIDHTIAYNTVQNVEHGYEAGKILGEFQRYTADIPPYKLHDTLPGFHHTPRYYEEFLRALEKFHSETSIERRKQETPVVELISRIRQRERYVSLLMKARESGELRERVVHNDPKINNMLFDAQTRKGNCLIDLDTVKSGLIQFDYGDCLRSAANLTGEDVRNFRHVTFSLDYFEAITRGYLEEAASFLSKTERAYLFDSIKVMTLELVIRFLTDYLKGDIYFHTSSPTQNLHRARVQFALLQDIERKEIRGRKRIAQIFANCCERVK